MALPLGAFLLWKNNLRNSLMFFSRAMFHSATLKAQPSGLSSKVFLRSVNLESCNPVLLRLYKLSLHCYTVYITCIDALTLEGFCTRSVCSQNRSSLEGQTEGFNSNPFHSLNSIWKHFLTSSCFSRIVEISVFGFLSITVHWCFYLIYYTVDISQSVCVKNFNPLYIFTMSNEQCLLFLCYLDWEIHIYLFCRMMDFASFCQHLSAPGLSWKLQNVILHFCMPCTRTVWSKEGC